MSRTYLPTSTQMDTTNAKLRRIAEAIRGQVDVSTWAGVQRAVRMGFGAQYFPIGTQLMVNHSVYGNCAYDVVAHDYLKSVSDANAHTMSIQKHDLMTPTQYDGTEAFYYASSALPTGTYNFTMVEACDNWVAETYQFTTTQTLPAGGQLSVSWTASAALTTLKVLAFASQTATTASEECVITAGSGGTNLGTFGVELNHAQRVAYGSNNYKESAIRQFLGSTAPAGSVWTPQTKYDRPPSWVSSLAGFANGLDSDFLAVVGEVALPCATNSIYEAPDSTTTVNTKYVLHDKFYLPTYAEIFGAQSGVSDDSAIMAYYEGATNADRIKYYNGSPDFWWLRTPNATVAQYARLMSNGGEAAYNNSGASAHSIAPMCTIV